MKWIEEIFDSITVSKNVLVKDIYDKITVTENKLSFFKDELIVEENKFLIEIFIKLNYSVLEGEYLDSSFSNRIKELISLVDTFFQFPDLSFLNLEEEGEYTDYLSQIKFLVSFKQCLEEYSKNQKFIDDIIKKLDKILVFNLSDRSSDIIDDLRLEKKEFELILCTIFLKNLSLSRKEFTLRNNEENLEILLNLNISFKECQTKFPFYDFRIKSILNVLIDKTTFLIRKLIIRKNQEKDSENQYYVAGGVEKLFLLDDHPLILDCFKKWDEYSQFHYLSDDNEIYKIKLKFFKEFENTYWDIHRLLKIAKDFDKNLSDLENTSLNEIIISTSNFDQYSKKISENYIKNCTLSCSVEKEKDNISLEFDFENFIILEENKIAKIQTESVINNFFPYKKICEFINEYIDFLNRELNKNNSIDTQLIEKLNKANSHLENFTKKYKTTLNWCSKHFYYAYQLPFKECISLYEKDGIKLNIFSPSTFSLPLNDQSLAYEIKILEGKIENCKNEIKSLNNFYSLFNRLDYKLTRQEEVLENSTKKNIELLGIFSAIIALLFQGAYTSQSENSFVSKLLTFATMFLVLSSFILMLKYFVTGTKTKNKEHTTIVFYAILMLFKLLLITFIIYKYF